ncbi:attacin-B [Chrysoperla carnea]|uniref:attacin-B n=1 Tax=Chrysoperla carnea TaxID=189513 RepID=UPI001D07CDE7|nr:attacin-B [Chrysoperla carnea]
MANRFNFPINTSLGMPPSSGNRLNFRSCEPKPTPPGLPINVSSTGAHVSVGPNIPNIIQSGPHSVGAHAHANIPLHNNIPPGAGGGINYQHASGHSASVNVDHVKHCGTTVQADANARLHASTDGSATLNLGAGASRHGNGPIQKHVGLHFNKQL